MTIITYFEVYILYIINHCYHNNGPPPPPAAAVALCSSFMGEWVMLLNPNHAKKVRAVLLLLVALSNAHAYMIHTLSTIILQLILLLVLLLLSRAL